MYDSQALPKFMAPRQSGDTRKEALGESRRYLFSGPLGGGAIGRTDILEAGVVGYSQT